MQYPVIPVVPLALDLLAPITAKERLIGYFLAKLESAKLNLYLDPMYRYTDALSEVDFENSEYVRTHAEECFILALARYENTHPIQWDPILKRGYRVGIRM